MIAKIIRLPAIAAVLASFLGGHAAPTPNGHAQVTLSVSSGSSEQTRYDEQQVWRLDWKEMNASLKEDIRTVVEIMNIDVWHASPSNIDLRLSPSQSAHLRQFIPPSASFTPMIPNLQSAIDLTIPAASFGALDWNVSTIDSSFHESYHTLDELYDFGDDLLGYFDGLDGLRMESFVVGSTFQDREIRGWKAWMEVEGDEDDEKKELEFLVQSGQHAREWIGPSTALYFLHSLLLSALDEDPDVLLALRTFTITVVPTINPDGYVFSHEHSRMWRKNRQYLGSDDCVGIDMNANWGYKWRAPQHNNPCAETYSGKAAFEAYETRAMADYLLTSNGRSPLYDRNDSVVPSGLVRRKSTRAFIDLHSYGQLFMYPFAHSCDDFPFDAENLMEASLGVAKAMRQRDGEAYMTGQACDLTYRAPGDAIDFTYGTTDVRWSFSTELRDTGVYGFLLPPSYIRSTGEEITAGLTFLAKFIYTTEIAG